MPVDIPPAFVRATVSREGGSGWEWLSTLPDAVDELLTRWDCVQDGEVLHGAVAIVVPVVRRGREAVVKVSYPHPGNTSEWWALAAFDGRAAVRLYEVNADRFAMLLERAHPQDLGALGDDEALAAAGEVARRLAVPAYVGASRLADLAGPWAEELWDDHRASAAGDRLADGVVGRAAEVYRRLQAEETSTLIHGDLHVRNVLRGDREPWLAIDPRGVAGTPCFDAGTVVRHRLLDVVAGGDLARVLERRVERFCEAASVDLELGMGCTQARFVSSYYWELRHGSEPAVAKAMRAAASAL